MNTEVKGSLEEPDYFAPFSSLLTMDSLYSDRVTSQLEWIMNYVVDGVDWDTEEQGVSAVLGIRRQMEGLYKKDPTGVDPTLLWDNTYRKFIDGEQQCKYWNLELSKYLDVRNHKGNTYAILERASRYLRVALGECPLIESLPFKMSSGSSTSIKTGVSNSKKFEESIHRNIESAQYDNLWRNFFPNWWSGSDVFADPVQVSGVPKNAEILRLVAPENTFSMFIQRGIGRHIRRRLRYVGLDLRFAQNKHRQYAKAGSKNQQSSTMDLVNASSLICHMLGYLLFNISGDEELIMWWKSIISPYISRTYTLHPSNSKSDGKVRKFEMLVSAGSGFCFELETAIFWSLCKASMALQKDHEGSWNTFEGESPLLSVYGDDIICDPHYFDGIACSLELVGLTVNHDKSYKSGPFRESCGADYWQGLNIRPWFKDKPWSPFLASALYNSIWRYSRTDDHFWSVIRCKMPTIFDTFLRRLYNVFAGSLLSRGLNLWGPDGFGDGHFISDDWEELVYGNMTNLSFADTVDRPWHPYLRIKKTVEVRRLDLLETKCFATAVRLPAKEHVWFDKGSKLNAYYRLIHSEPSILEYLNPKASADPFTVRGSFKGSIKVLAAGGSFLDDEICAEVLTHLFQSLSVEKQRKFNVVKRHSLASRLQQYRVRKGRAIETL